MIKNTQLFERLNMQFRAEFFNVFNHTQFATPYAVVGPPGTAPASATARLPIPQPRAPDPVWPKVHFLERLQVS